VSGTWEMLIGLVRELSLKHQMCSLSTHQLLHAQYLLHTSPFSRLEPFALVYLLCIEQRARPQHDGQKKLRLSHLFPQLDKIQSNDQLQYVLSESIAYEHPIYIFIIYLLVKEEKEKTNITN
jgi:hypothetical protein